MGSTPYEINHLPVIHLNAIGCPGMPLRGYVYIYVYINMYTNAILLHVLAGFGDICGCKVCVVVTTGTYPGSGASWSRPARDTHKEEGRSRTTQGHSGDTSLDKKHIKKHR